MVARGEVALVMIAAGQAAGLVDDQLFSATIVMTLLTTLVTPPLLRLALAAAKEDDSAPERVAARVAE
jgi:Kef-type K+ transport system membrane component KefB